MTELEEIWIVRPPMEWPTAPDQMSFSLLMELEACPRRWALSTASYPLIWAERGYPPPLHSPALEGVVIHLALKLLTRALLESGCSSVRDASAVGALRKAGGLSVVIVRCIDEVLTRYEKNPRVTSTLARAREHLTSRVGELRSRVQASLSRVTLEPKSNVGSSPSKVLATRPLTVGSYSEVRLEASDLKWCGVVDLLTISTTDCEIRDFKTGSPQNQHADQLRVYALLWARDKGRNPKAKLATRLIATYPSGDTSYPALGVTELSVFQDELKSRGAAALTAASTNPPQAQPARDNCGFCRVRQLCDAYWAQFDGTAKQTESFSDIQLTLVRRDSFSRWIAEVEANASIAGGERILLRAVGIPFELNPGQRLRLINVRISPPGIDSGDEETTPISIVTFGVTSEAFVLP